MKNKMRKAFGTLALNPKQAGVLTVSPPSGPYFDPKRVRIAAFDVEEPNKKVDLKIGAVTCGGSPQLAINCLIPDEGSNGIRPEDLDYVNWAVFSTVGLARELQISIYNPNQRRVLVFACIEGFPVKSLDCYVGERQSSIGFAPLHKESKQDQEERERKLEEWAKESAERDKQSRMDAYKYQKLKEYKLKHSGYQSVGSEDIHLGPNEQKVIHIIPTVSAYFEPHLIRFRSRRTDKDEQVPFCVLDAYCGDRLLYGMTNMDELFTYQPVRPRKVDHESPSELISKLSKMVKTLERHGPDGLNAIRDNQHSHIKDYRDTHDDPRGMLTTMLVDDDGWDVLDDWPVFSTTGLGQTFGVVAYNPWPFSIRASVVVAGNAVADLDHYERMRKDWEIVEEKIAEEVMKESF